jgi:uncharacterized protein YjbI with pentapeptide repeats
MSSVDTISAARFAELIARHDPQREDRFLKLLDTEVEGISVADKDLGGCILVRCRIIGGVFERCLLRNAQLFDSRLEDCRLTSCDLYKAELNGADLRGVDFTGSEMGRCDFTRADLRGANLTDCVLDWAWLLKCDMRDAILEGASFRGTRIGEARLYNSRRFDIGSRDQARVNNVDMSPEGDGSIVVQGDELWPMLTSR